MLLLIAHVGVQWVCGKDVRCNQLLNVVGVWCRREIPQVIGREGQCGHYMECVCYRIQSLVCSPSTSLFALSAMGSLSQPPSIQGSGRTTMGLTSPHLPSQMAKPSEMLPMNKRVMSTATSSRYQPTPGELTIWDLAEQKIQVTVNLCIG